MKSYYNTYILLLFIPFYCIGQQFFCYQPMHTVRSYLLANTNQLEKQTSSWHPFTFGFGQYADTSFYKNNQCKTVAGPLSNLFFGQSFFAPTQSLSPSSRNIKTAPLITAPIAPRVSIKTQGMLGGIQYCYAPDQHWQIGVRAQLPVIKTHTKKLKAGLPGKSLFGGPIATDFYRTAVDTVEGTTNPVNDFAIRLDFLSKLPASTTGPGSTVSFVNYNNSSTNTITMNGIDVTDKQTTVTNRNPVTVVSVPVNQTPVSPFGVLLDPSITPQPNTATTLAVLPANGTANDARSRFDQTVNYQTLATDTHAQSGLWVVPSVLAGPPAQLTQNARIISNSLSNILANINSTPEDAFEKYGISFCNTTTTGVGDFSTELFLDYSFSPKAYAEFICGICLPTGKTIDKTKNNIFSFATASNGHTSLYAGANGVCKPSEWFTIVSCAMIHTFLSAEEYIPVSFQGASVKNFNQLTPAAKSWITTSFGLDVYFHLPTYYKDSMITTLIFGYECFHKHKDNVRFVYPSVLDATGNIQPTDNRIAAFETNRQAHTIAVNVMVTFFEKINIVGGWNRVVHGYNIPKSNGWHVGFETYI
ncbi:hypothetical protein EKK58_12695 [Candidatus Dependentiae bacterium]|nr:MAG: hypothetical protein EKK58_12695 [Candidatus Dependentiae bacterium]